MSGKRLKLLLIKLDEITIFYYEIKENFVAFGKLFIKVGNTDIFLIFW